MTKELTRQEKEAVIMAEMSCKDLSFGCIYLDRERRECTYYPGTIIRKNDNDLSICYGLYYEVEDGGNIGYIKIIGHPVMIGDVLDWIDLNSNWEDVGDGHKTRNLEAHRKLIVSIYNHFIGGYRKPITEQSDECVEYLYNLIQDVKGTKN